MTLIRHLHPRPGILIHCRPHHPHPPHRHRNLQARPQFSFRPYQLCPEP